MDGLRSRLSNLGQRLKSRMPQGSSTSSSGPGFFTRMKDSTSSRFNTLKAQVSSPGDMLKSALFYLMMLVIMK